MSHIDKLIADLCPDGVEFVKIEDLFELKNGYTPSKSNSSFWENGTVPWFRMEDIRANGRILSYSLQQVSESGVKSGKLFPPNSLLVATSATIGEHALITVPHLSNQRFTSLSVKHKWKDQVDIKFLYHYAFILDKWCRANTTTSSFASVDMTGFKNFPIPIPPLEVQREIARVLDKFTQLEAELKAELKAELEARRQQYEYYRDQLLTFVGIEGVQWIPMGKIGTLTRGRRFTKTDMTSSGVPCIHYGEIYTHYRVSTRKTISHVRDILASKLRYAKPGDVVIAGVGETVKDVAKAVAWLGETPVAIHDDTFSFRSKQDPTYISYAMQTIAFQEQKERWVSRAKVKRIGNEGISQIVIPVPSLEEQRRIVSILDKFDSLVNDLSIGLPAELEARRKQYEYYRDRLLTFEEKR